MLYVDNPLYQHYNEIGKALSQDCQEPCQQSNSSEPLNIHDHVKQTIDNITISLIYRLTLTLKN